MARGSQRRRGGVRPEMGKEYESDIPKDDVYEAEDDDPEEDKHAVRFDVSVGDQSGML